MDGSRPGSFAVRQTSGWQDTVGLLQDYTFVDLTAAGTYTELIVYTNRK